MKNYSVTLTLFCLLIISASKVSAQKGFDIGIRYMVQKTALFNKSDKDAGSELDRESTLSYLNGGIAIGYSFSKCMGVEVDILHSRQGQKYSGTNMESGSTSAYNRVIALQADLNDVKSSAPYKARAELNSTKIPILLRLNSDHTQSHYFTLSVGPQVNILNNAVYELNGVDVQLPGINIVPNDTYRKVTFDGVLGLGAGFDISRHCVLSTQARFDYGFQDVEKKDITYSSGGNQKNYYGSGRTSTHNGIAALMIGLSYKL